LTKQKTGILQEFGLFDSLLDFLNKPDSEIQDKLVNGATVTIKTVKAWNEEYYYRLTVKERE
jgi:hypothetical protein